MSLGMKKQDAQGTDSSTVWGEQSPFLQQLFGMGQDQAQSFQPNTQIPGAAMGAWQNQLNPQQNPYMSSYADQYQDQLGVMNQQTGGQAGLTGGYGGGRHGIAESQNVQNMGGQMGRFYGDQYGGDMQRQQSAIGQAPTMLGIDPQAQQWANLGQYAGIIGGPHNEMFGQSTDKSRSLNAGIK